MKTFILISKHLLLSFLVLFGVHNSHAQQAPCWLNCDNLVTRNLPIATTGETKMDRIPYGRANAYLSGYKDAEYPSDCGEDELGNAVTDKYCRLDASQELEYEVYYPVFTAQQYAQCPLPPVILFHPGGFMDCTGAFGELMREYCRAFAKRGFVCFNVEYRQGVIDDVNPYYSAQRLLAFYRGFQDGRGAVRSIIKRQQNHAQFNDPYQIDIENIIVGGASAGAAIALNLGFYRTQGMIDAIAPNVSGSLGPIDRDYYYGETTISYFDRIKGVLNMWGNGFLPVDNADDPFGFFAPNSGHFPAVISFQGALDPVAPPGYQPVFFSPPANTDYHSEVHCLTGTVSPFVALTGVLTVPDVISFGSKTLYAILNDPAAPLYVPNEFYYDCDMGHGLDVSCNKQACPIPSAATCNDACATYKTDFATGYKTRPQVAEYIVQRSATFFQSVAKGYLNVLGARKNSFINCVNNRANGPTCNTADSYGSGCLTSCSTP